MCLFPFIFGSWVAAREPSTNSGPDLGGQLTDFSYSDPLTESILLGTLAIRTGRALDWDAKNLKINNNAEAAALIEIEAREGWRTSDLD